MRANRTLEIGTGFFVLLGFAALFFLVTQLPSTGISLGGKQGGYQVTAEFDNIGQLKAGAPVTMAGVNIGDVAGIRIDPQTYRALVTLRIDPRYKTIPDDSDASIETQGLLGGQYVAIGPGGSDMYLKNGSRITFTQSAFVLENLVNKLFSSFASKGTETGSGAAASGGTSGSGNASGAGSASGTGNASGSGKGGGGHPGGAGHPGPRTQ